MRENDGTPFWNLQSEEVRPQAVRGVLGNSSDSYGLLGLLVCKPVYRRGLSGTQMQEYRVLGTLLTVP